MKRPAHASCNTLLAAAHERCVAIMLSQGLGNEGAAAGKVKVAVHLTLGNISADGWTITNSHLVFTGNAPAPKAAEFAGSAMQPKVAASANIIGVLK